MIQEDDLKKQKFNYLDDLISDIIHEESIFKLI